MNIFGGFISTKVNRTFFLNTQTKGHGGRFAICSKKSVYELCRRWKWGIKNDKVIWNV